MSAVVPFRLEPPDQVADVVDPDGVEAGGRFVEEDVVGLRCQGPGNGDPLLHPPGELGRIVVDGVLQPDEAEFFPDDPLDLRLGELAVP